MFDAFDAFVESECVYTYMCISNDYKDGGRVDF